MVPLRLAQYTGPISCVSDNYMLLTVIYIVCKYIGSLLGLRDIAGNDILAYILYL